MVVTNPTLYLRILHSYLKEKKNYNFNRDGHFHLPNQSWFLMYSTRKLKKEIWQAKYKYHTEHNTHMSIWICLNQGKIDKNAAKAISFLPFHRRISIYSHKEHKELELMKKRSLTEILLSRFLFSLLKTVVVWPISHIVDIKRKNLSNTMLNCFTGSIFKVLQYSIVIRDTRDLTIDDAYSTFPSSLSTNSIFILLIMDLYPFTNPCKL